MFCHGLYALLDFTRPQLECVVRSKWSVSSAVDIAVFPFVMSGSFSILVGVPSFGRWVDVPRGSGIR